MNTNQTKIAALERSTEREASMGIGKFFRLLRLRLFTQGLKPTLLWLGNLFNSRLLDRPVRSQCQVTPQLFVGPQFKLRGWRQLQSWGITTVVNLRQEFDDLSLGIEPPHYLRLPLVDDDPISVEDLQTGTGFIDREIDAGRKVYIHCGAGVGRAPTMAAAYLIAQGDTPVQAINRIRAVRSFIRPTRGQREQLERFYELQLQSQTRNSAG